ncbi:hypothetical protein D9611_000242 [Ephemerocybe angulata]|uniref:Uncharacterized protein n=1 Tax=Ephemerocybe angulata TaxID=980116 RepID=A0A8H5BM64_9AGAR|nr:hypothetical protein D9611_000242 [Tulosesus angulatus]
MKFLSPITLLSLYLLSASQSVVSAPTDVYAPRILEPHGGETWFVGEKKTVIWDTTSPPKQITNRYGSIRLRKGGHTMDDVDLGSRFDILDGSKEITVPSVPEGSDYRIVLFGDSGNWSKAFSIANKTAEASRT